LDIQWAHAMAPKAKIILVEANSANLSDMFAAVSLAGSLVTAGSGGQVSLSWGASEFFGEASSDSTFTGSNVVYFAPSAASPGTLSPRVSPKGRRRGGHIQKPKQDDGKLLLAMGMVEGRRGPEPIRKATLLSKLHFKDRRQCPRDS